MGVKLEWQIDSDTRSRSKRHQEDPGHGKRRNRRLVRFFVLLLAVLLTLVGTVWLLSERLKQVDARQQQLLYNTVQAEIAALGVGETTTYMSLQRSATNDWIEQQRAFFNAYQQDKALTDRTLTGRVFNTTIDGQRGRVQVEEIEAGVPYVRTWFYWNYDTVVDPATQQTQEGGWRHVPPDYTFWGPPGQIIRERYVIRYQELDVPFATSMDEVLNRWFADLCTALACSRLPFVTIDIVPNPGTQTSWSAATEPQLIVPSPFVGRARYDLPFDTASQQDVAALLAERLVSAYSVEPSAGYDAEFLRRAAVLWLLGKWLQVDTQSYLMTSIANQYGAGKIGELLAVLRNNSDISILAGVLGVSSFADANLDWRDFLTWRLGLETQAASAGDAATLLRLYDQRDPLIVGTAQGRLGNPSPAAPVGIVYSQTAPDGTAQLVATMTNGQQVIFNLVSNVWLRGS
jgi:uncharacterized membrane protein (UPF0136 family)